MYIFLLAILCAVIVAPVFSTEYQTGADDIIRCTKNGRMRLATVKIASAVHPSEIRLSALRSNFLWRRADLTI